MKIYYIFILLALLSGNVAFSQALVEGETYGDERAEAFAGTWVGTNQTDSLVVKMWAGKLYIEDVKIFVHNVFGQYDYWRNGKLVESSIGSADTTISGGYIQDNPFRWVGLFLNSDNEFVSDITIFMGNPNSTVAEWAFEPPGEGRVTFGNNKPKPKPTSEVPRKITLRKIE